MQLSIDDLDLLFGWYNGYTNGGDAASDAEKDLYDRICAEIEERESLANFASDCGDSCKL